MESQEELTRLLPFLQCDFVRESDFLERSLELFQVALVLCGGPSLLRFFLRQKCSIEFQLACDWRFATVEPGETAFAFSSNPAASLRASSTVSQGWLQQTFPRRPCTAHATSPQNRFEANARLSRLPDDASLSQVLCGEYRLLPRPDGGTTVAKRQIMRFYWVLWKWGGRRGLNPRHSVPQTDALPAELLPPLLCSLSRHPARQNRG